ncbi:unnamed protein product [Knipowitschia caucasica]
MAGRRKGLWPRKLEEDFLERQNEGEHGDSEPSSPSFQPVGELVALLKDFLNGQERREEGLVAELRELRNALPAAQAPQTPTHFRFSEECPSSYTEAATGSAHLGLPTPGGTRVVVPPDERETARPLGVSWNAERDAGPEWRHFSDPKIPPFQPSEDIENYLLRFERIAKTWRWPETEWACRLVPLLSGKALDAYTAMDEGEAHNYTHLKAALLTKFDISPETYRQRFRATGVPAGETPTETYHRLRGLYRRWIRPDILSKDAIGELIVLEQLLCVLPPDVRMWVKEHNLEDGLTAAKLALQYQNAHRGFTRFPSSSQRPAPPPGPPSAPPPRPTQDVRGTNFQSAPGKTLICFYCQQAGHKASVCPMRRGKLTGACYAPRPETELVGTKLTKTEKLVTVNGQPAMALLDSGSFTSLIKRSLVPMGSIDYSAKTDVVCVHGDCHLYPRSDVSIELDGQVYLLTVAVVDNLPKDLILGNDFPLLMDLLQGTGSDFGGTSSSVGNIACPVVTRSQDQVTGLQPLPDLDVSLCEGGTKGPGKSKRQRRFEKGLAVTDTKGLIADGLWDVPGDIACLQRQDTSLKHLFDKVVASPNPVSSKEQFVVEEEILYACNEGRKRLVIPASCRQLVLHLAHTLPWAGHLGRHKTFLRVSTRFFWPGMYTDVQAYCTTCPTCQLTGSPRKSDRALLQPLPIVSVPFRRIAMDIIGPLPRSGRGHQYVLVVCDYAIKWAREEVRYLGYQLGHGEVRPQVDKVEAIRNCPRPRTKKEVRSFLGLAGWYRRFVPQFSTIAFPLTTLTTKDQKNPVNWTEQCEVAFKTLKDFLCSSPVLRSPDFTQNFVVQVDASAVGLGAVLVQGDPGEERPILYLSRKLLPREARYSVVEKEGLAIKWALESLRYYLLGREFILETDHRALTWINTMKDHNARLSRWYLSLQPFKFTVRHRKGTANVVADYLSRLPNLGNLGKGKNSVTE